MIPKNKYYSAPVLVVIPARKGSKGILGKNFKEVGGVSLTNRAIQHGELYGDFGPVILSTDDADLIDSIEVADFSRPKSDRSFCRARFGFIHKRPEKLSTDTSHIMELLELIVDEYEFETQNLVRGVLLLQPTSPFRSKDDFATMSTFLTQADEDSSIVSFVRVEDNHPARMYVQGNPGDFQSLSEFASFAQTRRQDLPPVFLRDGAFYYIGRNLINRQEQFHANPAGFERRSPWTLNVDRPEDLEIAHKYATRLGI